MVNSWTYRMVVDGHAKNVRVEWSGGLGSDTETKCYLYDSASTGRYLTTTQGNIENHTGSDDPIIRYSASQGGTHCSFMIESRDLQCL